MIKYIWVHLCNPCIYVTYTIHNFSEYKGNDPKLQAQNYT